MTLKNKTLQKFISSLLVIAIVLPSASFVFFSKPQKAEAVYGVADVVVDAVDAVPTVASFIRDILEKVLDAFLKALARRLLDAITQATVGWINSGFHGAPLFIENPGTFFQDIVTTELNTFTQMTAYDQVKFPFGKDFAKGIANNVTSKVKGTFESNAAYSLSQYNLSQAEFNRQQKDFAAGGFGGLLMNTQLMQNNFLGYGIIAEKEIATRLNGPHSAPAQVQKKVTQGLGFLSQESCRTNPDWDPKLAAQGPGPLTYIPPLPPPKPAAMMNNCAAPLTAAQCLIDKAAATATYNAQVAAADAQAQVAYNAQVKTRQTDWQASHGCPPGQVATTTPGSSLGGTVTRSLQSKGVQAELAAAVGNSLSLIFDSLLSKLFDMGLKALGSAVTGNNFIKPTPVPLVTDFNNYGTNAGTYADATNGTVSGTIGGLPLNPESTLNIVTDIQNQDGGQLQTSAGVIFIDGDVTFTGNTVQSGPHSVTVSTVPGYTTSISGDCSPNGDVTVGIAETKNCTITFDDIAGYNNSLPQLTVTEVINGGTYAQDSIPVYVKGSQTSLGIQYTYPVGPATVTAQIPIGSGYTMTIGGDCASDGTIDLSAGDIKNCTVTFNSTGNTNTIDQLKVELFISSNYGGTLIPANVDIVVAGTVVRPGIPVTIAPGTYTITSSTINGTYSGNYNLSFAGACDSTGNITINAGFSPTCVVIYNEY